MVKVTFKNQEWQVRPGMMVDAAMRQAAVSREEALPLVNKRLVSEDTILREGDVLELVPVVSGG
ncbi:MAG: MoaD/ThiS family protein [Chloroflexi bacterium]|nr:MoaD/ThiS family protein [Chloroflexota bacterium]MBU1750830.1 MoaD/ThiS family protein [Chloroflexota bacterium]MBU1878043.1 MoaD/ThiS family protein [Chloroflexota bacterium]